MAEESLLVTDNFARHWLMYFKLDGSLVTGAAFEVPCEVCNNRLAITEAPNGVDVEEFTVLPCGHALGYECLSQWLRVSVDPTCPHCRSPLFYDCERNLVPRSIKPDGSNMHDAISDCISETGELPMLCSECELDENDNLGRCRRIGRRTVHRNRRDSMPDLIFGPPGTPRLIGGYSFGSTINIDANFGYDELQFDGGEYADRAEHSPPLSPRMVPAGRDVQHISVYDFPSIRIQIQGGEIDVEEVRRLVDEELGEEPDIEDIPEHARNQAVSLISMRIATRFFRRG
ncbi:hypothetical protein F4802DRAFT_618955 [Xylaria palmicola]|nr:hypothetical protein F4802DRAFT_618955 [Xylaria palmicola]